MDLEDRIALVNKPPIEEIVHFDLVNKPPIDELYHHGILGMRWGIRRYQNPDGSLTPEGLARQRKQEKQRRDRILSDPKLLEKHVSEFSKEEIERALSNFDYQKRLREVESKHKAAKQREFEHIIDNLTAAGDKVNDIIDFLNSKAGKLLRKSLGYGTDDIGNFKNKKDIEKDNEEKAKKAEEKKEKKEKQKQQKATNKLVSQKILAEVQAIQYKNYAEWLALPEEERKKIPMPSISSL